MMIRIVVVPVYHDKESIPNVLVGEVVQDGVDGRVEGHCNDGYDIYHGCSVFVTVVDVCEDVINEAWREHGYVYGNDNHCYFCDFLF